MNFAMDLDIIYIWVHRTTNNLGQKKYNLVVGYKVLVIVSKKKRFRCSVVCLKISPQSCRFSQSFSQFTVVCFAFGVK